MTHLQRFLPAAVMLLASAVKGQQARPDPHVGYLYPAGGQAGASFEVVAGGQFLQGANAAYVTGGGVTVKVTDYARALSPKQLGDAGKVIRQLVRDRIAEKMGRRAPSFEGRKSPAAAASADKPVVKSESKSDVLEASKTGKGADGKKAKDDEEKIELPDHPWLRDLEKKDLTELRLLAARLFDPKRQQNSQLGEMVFMKVTIDPDATPGDRELRIGSRAGLTNPMVFQIGQAPEVLEIEPNDPKSRDIVPSKQGPGTVGALAFFDTPIEQPVFDVPVLINGQIRPGDVDRFRFRARRGQRLVIETHARHLIPYLADAVPGWFQATLALFDAKGDEIAFTDDFRFDPDPVLFFEVPQDGEYQLEIRDSIYRGREDFVYRVTIGEKPFVTRIFPLGGPEGVPTVATIGGWNLRGNQLPLDTRPGGPALRMVTAPKGQWQPNPIPYAVDTLPEILESESNNDPKHAQKVVLPLIVNGRIETPGDADVFRFEGRAGDEVVAEIVARRLRSPLDSLLRLTDESGDILQWNDDFMPKEGHLHKDDQGWITHHADSYVRCRLPKNGTYYVHVLDAQQAGGDAHAYRLRLSPPRPDFALRIVPSSLNIPAGRPAPVRVYALRADGFRGEIELSLKNTPPGFSISGARIPAGCDSVRFTVCAPPKPMKTPVSIHFVGQAVIGGQTVTRPAVPAEDMMQAFLWRHLAPSQELLVANAGFGRFGGDIRLADERTVRIAPGGEAEFRVRMPKGSLTDALQWELSDPPKGLSLGPVRPDDGGVTFVVRADAGMAASGSAGNLIIEAFTEISPKGAKGSSAGQKRRASAGVLPAIPFEIAQK